MFGNARRLCAMMLPSPMRDTMRPLLRALPARATQQIGYPCEAAVPVRLAYSGTLARELLSVSLKRAQSASSSATSVSAPLRGGRLPATLGRLRLFDFDDLGRRDLARSPLDLEWRLIAFPRAGESIVAGRRSTLEVVYWCSGHSTDH